MRASSRKSKSLPYLILGLLALPFVVGFDMIDTSGTYAKVSGGRGAYHLTGCHRDFDSEYMEGEIAMRHSFETRENVSQSSMMAYFKPRFTTLGYFADFEGENLTLIKIDSTVLDSSGLGRAQRGLGFAGGVYLGLDWEWAGLNLGLGGTVFNVDVDSVKRNRGFPMLGLRIGPSDVVYATFELNGSNPYLSGGAWSNIGVGGKWGHTRAWFGSGTYQNGYAGMTMVRLNHDWGPWDLGMALQFGSKDIPPAGMGIDREGGFSLAVAYRLSTLDKK